jgi:hypothetical protein
MRTKYVALSRCAGKLVGPQIDDGGAAAAAIHYPRVTLVVRVFQLGHIISPDIDTGRASQKTIVSLVRVREQWVGREVALSAGLVRPEPAVCRPDQVPKVIVRKEARFDFDRIVDPDCWSSERDAKMLFATIVPVAAPNVEMVTAVPPADFPGMSLLATRQLCLDKVLWEGAHPRSRSHCYG